MLVIYSKSMVLIITVEDAVRLFGKVGPKQPFKTNPVRIRKVLCRESVVKQKLKKERI